MFTDTEPCIEELCIDTCSCLWGLRLHWMASSAQSAQCSALVGRWHFVRHGLCLQIARQVKDALREAHELVQPAANQAGNTAPANAGQQASERASIRDAAVHDSSSHLDGSAVAVTTASAECSGDVVDMMAFEGEELTASELGIAQAADQVLRSSEALYCSMATHLRGTAELPSY